MRDYDEDQAYDEVREDFIEEFKDQLKQRGKGEEMEFIAEGTPFESFMIKGDGASICPSMSMELVYINCYTIAAYEIDEAARYILGMHDNAERIACEQLEQIDNVLIFPMNLSKYWEKLEKNHITYMPYRDMAITFQFIYETENRSYCKDVKEDHLIQWGINVEELFEKVRYKEVEEIGTQIINVYDNVKKSLENNQSIIFSSVEDVREEARQVYQVYGVNGFGAVFYPKVMEEVIKKLGGDMVIVPDDGFTAYIQTFDVKDLSDVQEELQFQNETKEAIGDGRHVISGHVFNYDEVKKSLVPAIDSKIEKYRTR